MYLILNKIPNKSLKRKKDSLALTFFRLARRYVSATRNRKSTQKYGGVNSQGVISKLNNIASKEFTVYLIINTVISTSI